MKNKIFKILVIAFFLFGIFPYVASAEETTYSVNVTALHNNRRLSYVEVMISENNETITYETTNRNGVATFELPNGTYTAVVGYVSGNYSYYGTTEFTVDGASTNVTVNVDSEMNKEGAKAIYDRTTYFNHVDIRVNGTFTTGIEGNTTTDKITLQNVELLVVDGTKTLIDTTFKDNTETYEWRVTGQSIPKTAKVSLIFDIVVDGKTIRENFEYSFEGEEDFIQAIIDCDNNQGLDFIIDPTEITEAIYYSVSYEWSGLPENLATPPATTNNYLPDSSHTVNTHWLKDAYIIDEANHIMYKFSGWTTYSNTTVTNKEINGSETITVTSDTTIYGVWTSESLLPTSNYLVIRKTFIDNDNYIPKDLHFKITTPTGLVIEIPYSDFTDGEYKLPINEVGTNENPYIIEEHNYDIKGYTYKSAITDTTKRVITDLSTEVTVTFTNEYQKKSGTNIHNYPSFLIEKADSKDGGALSGATFTLTPTDNTKNKVVSVQTNESGYTSFTNIEEGTYILTETTAPAGYHKETTEYIVTVTLANTTEKVYDESQDAYINIYDYVLSITPTDHYNATSHRLTVYNEKITGSITISKDFGSNSKYNQNNYPANNKVEVQVTGPNNYLETITLDTTNNWTTILENLELGTYTIEEIITNATIPGYTLNTTYTNGNDTTTTKATIDLTVTTYTKEITITNTYTKIPEDIHNEASFTVKKTDKKGNLLSGATFGLYDSNNKLITTKTTDEKGTITFTGFNKSAEYTLKELSAPTNYQKVNTEWKIIVTLKNGQPSTETGDNIYNWNVTVNDTNYQENTLIVVNELMTGKITITKEVQLFSNNETIEKNIEVKDVKYSFTVIIGDKTYTVELADGESKTFENIPYGTKYQVTENIPKDATWSHTAPTNALGTISSEETDINMVNIYNINNGFGEEDVEENKDNNKVPQTGDTQSIYLYSLITIIGMIGLIITSVKYKKNF